MAFKIRWHVNARNDFFEMVDYFVKEGQIQAAENFRTRVIERVIFIGKYPEAGRPTARRKYLRFILIDDYRRLYYRFTSKTITLLAVFDARQDPDKAPY